MTRIHHFAFAFTLALGATFAAVPHAAFALGSTPVTVVNPDDPAAFAKAEGIQHPFTQAVACHQAAIVCSKSFLQVPANQRWIVEFASFSCTSDDLSPVVDVLALSLSTITAGNPNSFELSSLPTFTGNVLRGSQIVRLYADPNTQVTVTISLNSAAFFDCSFAISGQAIDVP